MVDEIQAVIGELSSVTSNIKPEEFTALARAIMEAERVFVAGMGRSGLVIKSFAMRLMHMGKAAYVVGDITTPPIREKDLLLVASGSGNTMSLVSMARKARAVGAGVALVTIHPESQLGELADCMLTISAPAKADGYTASISAQPMATLFEQGMLIMLDSMVLRLMSTMGTDADAMFRNHANLE